ncbi:MAG: hypothetical protein KTR35_08825 [Gammaproteobacteria bacterium]|nr:hypothetical protein [Gammaproteobacteria bacterium]
MATAKDDLPVLKSVVETGNESIIQSTRLGHEVLAELESLRQGAQSSAVAAADGSSTDFDTSDQGNLAFDFTHPVELNAEMEQNGKPTGPNAEADHALLKEAMNSSDDDDPLLSEAQPTLCNNQQLEDDEIELMIDEVVDRHITELRKDIKRLLERAKSVP